MPPPYSFFYKKYPRPDGEELAAINGSPKLLYHLVGSSQKEDENVDRQFEEGDDGELIFTQLDQLAEGEAEEKCHW
mgnify:CR=1 FL=1